MARALSADIRNIRKAVRRLEVLGYLETEIGRGRGHSSTYRPVLPERAAVEVHDSSPDEERKAGKTAALEKGGEVPAFDDVKAGTSPDKTGHFAPPQPYEGTL
jgi:hypothetical protein